MSELAEKIVKITADYMGPAAEVFLRQQTSSHMNGLKFTDIRPEDLDVLAYWVKISGGLVMDKDQARELAEKISPNPSNERQKSAKPVATYLDPPQVVAIGSSTGGPEALAEIIQQFPADFPAGIVIVQHMPKEFTPGFADHLNRIAKITVKEAENDDLIKPGLALLAPGDFHMTFVEDQQDNRRLAKVKLTKEPPVLLLRPTVNKMMDSLPCIYGKNIIGVILTGMGEDGLLGMKGIKDAGGQTLVQNKETSAVYGMGKEVVINGLADKVLPLRRIVPELINMIEKK